MPVPGGGHKGGPVLQLADDAIEALIRLQRQMLRVFVADTAQLAAQLGLVQRGVAETAGRRGQIARHRELHFTIAASARAL